MNRSTSDSGSDLQFSGEFVEPSVEKVVSMKGEPSVEQAASDKKETSAECNPQLPTSQSESGTDLPESRHSQSSRESSLASGIHSNDQSVDEQDKTVISRRPVAAPAEFFSLIPLAELAKILEGRQLDHFSVEQMIGGGGMGAVFRGRDLRLDRTVAIKVIPASKGDVDTLRRFRMEAQSAARLDHPNIARVYYIGEAEDWNYIVFEFIDGVNMRDLVDMEGPLSVDDAVFYTRQVAEALQHASDRNVVHRDIKPSNVLITPSGVAKVVDMGLARSTSLDRSTTDLTASGVTLGTFDYISPEQAKNPRDADVRSDLYSLGCTLYFMLAGRPPFPDGTALQKLLNHGSQTPPDVGQWRDDVSDQLYAVLMKLMAKRPAERYQKPTELINDLMLVAESEDLQRSRTPGTILLTPTLAERSLWEAMVPWLVAFAFLLGSAFWLQSAQSLSGSFELPQPVYVATAKVEVGGNNIGTIPKNSSNAGKQLDISPNKLPQNPDVGSPTFDDRQMPAVSASLPASPANHTQSGLQPSRSDLRDSRSHGNADLLSSPTSEPQPSVESVGSSPIETTVQNIVTPREATPAKQQFAPWDEHLPSSATNDPEIVNEPSYAGPSALATAVPTSQASGNYQTNSSRDNSVVQKSDTILVSNVQPADVAGQLWSNSLNDAMARAATNTEIRNIELGSDVVVRNGVSIPRDGLTIRAAPNTAVEMRFSPTRLNSFGLSNSLIEVADHTLTLEGVSISATLPSGETVADFTVFGLSQSGHLELSNSNLTMNGHAGMGNVQFVAVRAMERDMPLSDDFQNFDLYANSVSSARESADTDAPASVRLRGCIVRGESDFLGIEAGQRVEVAVEQTLVALSERMINSIALSSSQLSSPSIRLSLRNSTFVCGNGFCRLGIAGGQAGMVNLNRSAQSCVFWSPPTVPHIVLEVSKLPTSIDEYLLIKGEDNAYDQGTTAFCQTRVKDGGSSDFGFSDGVGTWFREAGNENVVRWQNVMPPPRPFYDAVADDFKLRGFMFMPGYSPADVLSPNLEY